MGDSEVLFQGKWIQIHKRNFLSRTGQTHVWEYATRVGEREDEANGVEILAFYKEQLITIVEYRYPVEQKVLEVPAGLFDREDRDAGEVAIRELKEETGYLADEVEFVSPILAIDPWKSTETTRLVKLRVPDIEENRNPIPQLEDEESISVKLFPLDNLHDEILEFCSEEGLLLDSRLYLFALGLKDRNNS